MRILIGAAVFLAACTSATTPSSPTAATGGDSSPPGDRAMVLEIYDGDSLLASADGNQVEVRLLGVNAPEGSECYGDAARDSLAELLSSGEVTLVADTEDSDQFGRALRYVYVDGVNVNLALLTGGAALAVQGDHSLDTEFAAASDTAATDRLGMWGADVCGAEDVAGSVEIADFVYNPEGKDDENMNGEWVAINNTGDQPVDLAGWILRDESTQNRFRFPEGIILGSGQEVIVRSGCGSNSTDELYWCADNPIWSNGGDTVILQLPTGEVVARERFSGDF